VLSSWQLASLVRFVVLVTCSLVQAVFVSSSLLAMAIARVRMPTNLSEAFSMKLADFITCWVEDGEDPECAKESVLKIMVVLKGQQVATTKRLAHTSVRCRVCPTIVHVLVVCVADGRSRKILQHGGCRR
jgi:hypothetical protein